MNKATNICTINDITSIEFYLVNCHKIEIMVSASGMAPRNFSQRVCRFIQNLQNGNLF